MADELEIFKKSLEIVDSIPSLSIESIEKYLKEIDTHTDGGLKATILVIDDDKKIRDSLQTILEKKYNVILCENGQSGLQALTSSTFCVILDIKKSKDGFNTFLKLKSVS